MIYCILRIIPIDKPSHNRVIIPALEVVHTDFGVIIIPAITVGVNRGDGAVGGIGNDRADTPCVVGITRNSFNVLIENRYNIALQIFLEVIGFIVIHDTADAVLVVIQRDNGVVVPSLAQNLRAVEGIGVFDTTHSFRGTNPVGVVGIAVAVERLELPSLFPRERMPKVCGRVALRVVGDRLS